MTDDSAFLFFKELCGCRFFCFPLHSLPYYTHGPKRTKIHSMPYPHTFKIHPRPATPKHPNQPRKMERPPKIDRWSKFHKDSKKTLKVTADKISIGNTEKEGSQFQLVQNC